jgi:hypothetical protein
MMRKLDIEQRALAVAPEVSFRWTDDSKRGNEQNSTPAWCCSAFSAAAVIFVVWPYLR